VSESLNGDYLVSLINQSASQILLQCLEKQGNIETSTGYTFDADGLRIAASDKDFSVMIDEDEVTFTKISTGEVLATFTANYTQMKQLEVTDRLRVGSLNFQKVVVSGETRTWLSFSL